VAATGRAPLSLTALGLLVAADLLLPLGDGDCVRLPQRECVEWRGGPASARTTVAVPCSHRLTGDRDLDCTTKALSLVDAYAILQRVSCKLQAGIFPRAGITGRRICQPQTRSRRVRFAS